MKSKFLLSGILTFVIASLLTVMACANPVPAKSKGQEPSKEKPVCATWIHPDSLAYSTLGRSLTNILFNPKKVKVFTVAVADSTNKDNVIVEPHFVIDSMIQNLDKQQIAVLDFILLSDSRNYSRDSIRPMIPHYPRITFEFSNKTGKALVWYCPDDFTWGIRYDDKQIFKYNVADIDLMNAFCKRIANSNSK